MITMSLLAALATAAALADAVPPRAPTVFFHIDRLADGRLLPVFWAQADFDAPPFRADVHALRLRYRRVDVESAEHRLSTSVSSETSQKRYDVRDQILTVATATLVLGPGLYRFDADLSGLIDSAGRPLKTSGTAVHYVFLPAGSTKDRALELGVLKARFAGKHVVARAPFTINCTSNQLARQPAPAGRSYQVTDVFAGGDEIAFAPQAQVSTTPTISGPVLQWFDGYAVDLLPTSDCDSPTATFKTASGLERYLSLVQ